MTKKRKRAMKLAQSIGVQRNDFLEWLEPQLQFNKTYTVIIDFLIIGKFICDQMKSGDNIWDTI